MNDLRAAAQQALEALEYLNVTAEHRVDDRIPDAAIVALRAALAQQEQEPVADLRCAFWLDPECADAGACQSLKFKANPPRREWVSLTDEEVWSQYQTLWPLPVASDMIRRLQFRKFARAIEQACKERNT
jgi:hypothetical protein